mmetsp:Transcript_33023/g.48453  ORF Transcript_33023/g.48453 Transcript_33023/m.48453 type:complete len:369 (+) Transcript_33023:265-1371(+)
MEKRPLAKNMTSENDENNYILTEDGKFPSHDDFNSQLDGFDTTENQRIEPSGSRNIEQQLQHLSGTVVKDVRFMRLVVFMIIINSVMMGIATFDFVTDDPDVNQAFESVDFAFLIFFTIELGLQFIHRGLSLFSNRWLTFDFIVVAFSWMSASFMILRTLRIFRVLRLVTRVRVLNEIVAALINTIPKLIAIAAVLFLIFYVYAVMLTLFFKDMYEEGLTSYDYFSRLDKTFLTLFQLMTLDSWSTVTKEVMEVYPWSWVVFVSFVTLSSFTVVNLIIAVICDAIQDLHRGDFESTLEAVISQSKTEEGERNTESSLCSHTDVNCVEKKVNDLSNVVEQILSNQKEMQLMLEDIMKAQNARNVTSQNR